MWHSPDFSFTFFCADTDRQTESSSFALHLHLNFEKQYSLSDGPDDIHFAPNTTNYTVRSGDYLAYIVCMAECNPRCTYAWNKGFNIVAAQILSLDFVERTAAGTYTCVASQGTASIRKGLTVDVMCMFYVNFLVLRFFVDLFIW